MQQLNYLVHHTTRDSHVSCGEHSDLVARVGGIHGKLSILIAAIGILCGLVGWSIKDEMRYREEFYAEVLNIHIDLQNMAVETRINDENHVERIKDLESVVFKY